MYNYINSEYSDTLFLHVPAIIDAVLGDAVLVKVIPSGIYSRFIPCLFLVNGA